jgi:hypothetical protein
VSSHGPCGGAAGSSGPSGCCSSSSSSACLGSEPDEAADRAARGGAAAQTPTPTPTPDPAAVARAKAASQVKLGDYPEAIRVLEDAGLATAADRVRRRGVRTLLTSARKVLNKGRYEVAKAAALAARQLAPTPAAWSTLAVANEGIARERAEARERRRQARIARDQRTCDGGRGTRCARAAASRPAAPHMRPRWTLAGPSRKPQRRRRRRAAPRATAPCIPPYPPDLNCPDVGPVTVTGSDPHGLDADGDEVACGGD